MGGAARPVNQTPFTETEAFLALLDGDERRCEELLRSMFPHELHSLLQIVSDLRTKIIDVKGSSWIAPSATTSTGS